MNVDIRTVLGERRFDLTTEQMAKLLELAEQWEALTGRAPEQKAAPEPEWKAAPSERPEAPTAPPENSTKPSREEPWFGTKPKVKAVSGTSTESAPEPDRTHRGFLMIRCEECGKITGACVKNPITDFRCSCGHSTPLRSTLRPLEYTCKCGANFRYYTNLEDKMVKIDCFNCGAPVTVVLGPKGKYMQM